MVNNTKKFSEFLDGGTLAEGDVAVGLKSGSNARVTSSTQFQLPGTTAERPDPAVLGMIRFNTDLELYEFYNGTLWTQLEDSADIALLIARLAAHTAGDGASMIGLENQGAVSDKTVQDLAEADFIVKSVTSSLANAIALSGLSTGLLVNETGTGNLVARTFTGTSDQIVVTNGDGLSANPQASIAINPQLVGNSNIRIPFGTSAQRPAVAVAGMIRYNTTINDLEFYNANASQWEQTGSTGSVISVVGTTNQIDVDSSTPTAPVVSISPTLDLPGTVTVQGTSVIDEILDEDNMMSDSATALATQQSIKAYVDAQVGPGANPTFETVTFSPTTGGIVGTTTNDSADAGFVGEFISSQVGAGTPVVLTNATDTNVTSISLTAGDWDVWGNVNVTFSGVAGSFVAQWISLTSATLPPTDLRASRAQSAAGFSISAAACPGFRFSLSGTTTVYLSVRASFASGTAAASGGIYARRRR